jgi:hypothetical protein
MGWDEPIFRGVWFRGEWDGLVPIEEYSSQIRDQSVRPKLADELVPPGTSDGVKPPLCSCALPRETAAGSATAAVGSATAAVGGSATPSRRPVATTSGGEGRGGVGHGCCKRRCRWLQMALIPSLPRSLNQTKNWDRPILQTKHPNGIIPILKSGMVSSHPT